MPSLTVSASPFHHPNNRHSTVLITLTLKTSMPKRTRHGQPLPLNTIASSSSLATSSSLEPNATPGHHNQSFHPLYPPYLQLVPSALPYPGSNPFLFSNSAGNTITPGVPSAYIPNPLYNPYQHAGIPMLPIPPTTTSQLPAHPPPAPLLSHLNVSVQNHTPALHAPAGTSTAEQEGSQVNMVSGLELDKLDAERDHEWPPIGVEPVRLMASPKIGKQFIEKDAGLRYLNKVARHQGYVLSIKGHKTENHQTLRVMMECSKANPPNRVKAAADTEEKDSIKARSSSTKKTGCTFEVSLNYHSSKGRWVVVSDGVKNPHKNIHNHPPFDEPHNESRYRRISPKNDENIALLSSAGVRPRQIRPLLDVPSGSNPLIRDIYNARARHKKTWLNGRTPIQGLFDLVTELNWAYRTITSENGTLQSFFFASPQAIQLTRRFPTVLAIDCTYKTNRFNLPLLHIVGTTNSYKSFTVALCFMHSETEDQYEWAMRQLRDIIFINTSETDLNIPNSSVRLPKTFATDAEPALFNAIATVFPESAHILCIWHINENISRNCKKTLGSEWDAFIAAWNQFCFSSTPEEYDSNLKAMTIIAKKHDILTYLERIIPEGIRQGWSTSIDFKALESRIATHVPFLSTIIDHPMQSSYFEVQKKKWNIYGRQMFSMTGEFEGFEVEQPGYYGCRGFEVIVLQLQSQFLSKSSEHPLTSEKAAPLTPEYFIRRVLVPEISLLLIAEDLGCSRDDPKVKVTLETSRNFGSVVYPIEDEDEHEDVAQQLAVQSYLETPKEQLLLKQLPALIIPYIKSIHDPPAFGNCGFYAIAASMDMYSKDAYLIVRRKLQEELTSYPVEHIKLISTPPKRPQRKTRNYQTYVDEFVQELIGGLNHEAACCTKKYWLRMPTLGFVIASAFNRPVILFTPSNSTCYSFFPYRTPPNKQAPIILAFVNTEHFVRLGIDSHLIPFPEVYGQLSDRKSVV